MRLTISTKSVTKEVEELLKVTGGHGGSVIIGSLLVTIIVLQMLDNFSHLCQD